MIDQVGIPGHILESIGQRIANAVKIRAQADVVHANELDDMVDMIHDVRNIGIGDWVFSRILFVMPLGGLIRLLKIAGIKILMNVPVPFQFVAQVVVADERRAES